MDGQSRTTQIISCLVCGMTELICPERSEPHFPLTAKKFQEIERTFSIYLALHPAIMEATEQLSTSRAVCANNKLIEDTLAKVHIAYHESDGMQHL